MIVSSPILWVTTVERDPAPKLPGGGRRSAITPSNTVAALLKSFAVIEDTSISPSRPKVTSKLAAFVPPNNALGKSDGSEDGALNDFDFDDFPIKTVGLLDTADGWADGFIEGWEEGIEGMAKAEGRKEGSEEGSLDDFDFKLFFDALLVGAKVVGPKEVEEEMLGSFVGSNEGT